MRLVFLAAFFMCAILPGASAPENGSKDTVTVDSTQQTDSVKKRKGLINRFLDYINESNKTDPGKKFDFSLLGGPHYSTDTKFGLGLVATGIYRTDMADTLLPPSNTALYGDITTGQFYKIGIRGTHIFPHDKCRLDYNVSFDSFKSSFWGIGYVNGNKDSNESTMDRTLNVGAGVSLVYDSRDVLTNAHRGFYVNISQLFRPAFMGNDYAFATTDLRADVYRTVWKGGVVAADLRGTLNFGNPSWGMMSLLGNSYSMRGYYEGRYRDKHKLEAQVELRQHVWKRNGIALWAGVGTVFNKFSALRSDRLLPNFGIGYRWEFKKDVNVRLDYGFGKSGQSGFIFNIGEAF